MRLHSLIVVALFSLGACSSDQVRVEPAKLTDFQPTQKLEVRWSTDIGGAGRNQLFPAVTREAVYAANAEGMLYRLDRNNGRKIWSADAGFRISGGVGAGEGLVLAGGEKGELAAFDESKGKLVWQVDVRSDVLSPPAVADGVVVVRTGNQRIMGLSAKDGSRLWLYERATPALIVRSHAGVTIRNGLVYAGFAAGKLAAIDLGNGAVVWESAVSQPRGNTELERISDITSLPVVDNNLVCAVAFQGRLACFDPMRGAALWTRDISSDKGLAIFGKAMYLTDTDGNMLALDVAGGASLWKNGQLLARGVSGPYPLREHVLVGDFEGYLHLFRGSDGAIAARRETDGSAIRIAPMAMGDGALVLTSGGMLYSVGLR